MVLTREWVSTAAAGCTVYPVSHGLTSLQFEPDPTCQVQFGIRASVSPIGCADEDWEAFAESTNPSCFRMCT